MTETRFTWRWLLVIALVGIIMGLAVGLAAGWIIFPNVGTSNIAALSAQSQQDYIVLVANTYAYDQDAAAAKRRLDQLQDKDIKTRVERLAKSLAVRKDTSAANVADLAIVLGSQDSSLQVLAEQVTNTGSQSDAEPTKIAHTDDGSVSTDATAEPTAGAQATTEAEATAKPTKTKKAKETPTPEPLSTKVVAATRVPATKAATSAPTQAPAAAAVQPEWHPDYPGQWWDGVQFVPASVAAGQQYWHLQYALYCDVLDQRNSCPDLPGGGNSHGIYVSVLNPDGSCAEPTINHLTNTGDTTPLEKKDVLYPWNRFPCNVDYEWGTMYGEGNDVWIEGLPSDRLNGMCLCNKTAPPGGNILNGHAHVRYFLVFQKTTR